MLAQSLCEPEPIEILIDFRIGRSRYKVFSSESQPLGFYGALKTGVNLIEMLAESIERPFV